MGDELLEILEGQKRLDRQVQQMDRGSLRETARGMSGVYIHILYVF